MTPLNLRRLIAIQYSRPRSFSTAAVGSSSYIEFPQFSNVTDLIQYVETHLPSMDSQTLSQFVISSSFALLKFPDKKKFCDSAAMKNIVAAAINGFSTQDGNTATQLLRGISGYHRGSFKKHVPACLKDAANAFCNLMTSNKLSLSPSEFATASESISRLAVDDPQVASFIASALPNYIPQMTPRDCCMMFRAVSQLNVDNRLKLFQMIGTRLSEDMHSFNNSDFVDIVAAFAVSRYVVPDVFFNCMECLKNNTSIFEGDELVRAAEALVKLDQFHMEIRKSMIEEISKKLSSLPLNYLGRVLGVLNTAFLGSDGQFANSIIGKLVSLPSMKSLECEVDMALAICSYQLQDKKSLLQSLLETFSSLEFCSVSILLKMLDVFECAKVDFGINVEFPKQLKEQVEQYYTDQKVPLHRLTVKDLIGKLPENYQLSVDTGIRVGPYLPSLVDKKNKFVIEVSNLVYPFIVRQRFYESLGYTAVNIYFNRIRKVKDPVSWDRCCLS